MGQAWTGLYYGTLTLKVKTWIGWVILDIERVMKFEVMWLGKTSLRRGFWVKTWVSRAWRSMLAIPVCGVEVPKHKNHKFKASFGHVLTIKKEKTQPTLVLFVHLWKSFPDSGKSWAWRSVFLDSGKSKHNIYDSKSWVFKEEQEANRVREDWVTREDCRVGRADSRATALRPL